MSSETHFTESGSSPPEQNPNSTVANEARSPVKQGIHPTDLDPASKYAHVVGRNRTESPLDRGVDDFDGRFHGGRRVDVEDVPRLPTFPVAWALADPRERPYFVFWTRPDGTMAYMIRVERVEERSAVRLRNPKGESFLIRLLRRPMPRRGGAAILFLCPWCSRPRRYLYLLSVAFNRLVAYQGPRCHACAGLRWSPQGRYRSVLARALQAGLSDGHEDGHQRRLPYPRHPWDPRAVSDPQLVMAEFPDHVRELPPAHSVPTQARAREGARTGAAARSSA